ncbi:hypothetical protein [Blastopirellula retiformator]|uniref:hypothetical protein n=1 Tax=Blastopirellula retiformator TaxID=2527970 RepID=UPI0011B830B4|nr:hypothetical protein [Blastopirellula retiformator]
MNIDNCENWPFNVSDADMNCPEIAEKIDFLRSASDVGAESYRFGINNYGAKLNCRSGAILERGRNRWEIRLSQDDLRYLSAFVGNFVAAGNALTLWLRGEATGQILDNVSESLIVPPGLKESFTVYEAEQK